MSPLYLIDGSGYVFRAFYAIAPLSNSKGLPTNALFGFTRMMIKLLRDVGAEYVAVTFDTAAPTFRHELYGDYKANREECPITLVPQLPYFRDIVRALGIHSLEQDGVEADDIIGTLTKQFEGSGQRVVIVSGDKDLTQLVDESVEVWDAMRDVHFTPEGVRTKFGVSPSQIVDYLTLVGDTSDNVPGVAGIGPKTAVILLDHFKTLDALLEDPSAVANIPGLRGAAGVRERIESHLAEIRLSRRLVTLDTRVPQFLSMNSCETFRWRGIDSQLATPLFHELEFDSLLDALPRSDGSASSEAPRKKFVLVTPELFEEFVKLLGAVPEFAFDTETTGLDPRSAELVGMSFSWAIGEAYYLPLGGEAERERQLDADTVHRKLKPIFADPQIRKIGFHAKFDINILRRAGYEVNGLSFDPMLAAYVLNPDRRQHSLAALTRQYLAEEMTEYRTLVGKRENIGQVPIDAVKDYACHDAEATFSLKSRLDPLLEPSPVEERDQPSLRRVFEVLEVPLIPVLAEMEWRGIKVDLPFLAELEGSMTRELDALQGLIVADAGMEFNLNSPKQLAQVLFEHLRLPTTGVRKNQSALSTDAAVLQKLAGDYPIAAKILEYREIFKLKSTYVDALRRLVHPETGRIHTSFNQTVAATGRLSSSEPNLQNIPIRNERGRQLRRAFIAEEGFQLLAADYSQIELRLLAHLSGDKGLQRAFHEGEDIHSATAKEIFGPLSGEGHLRRVAKTINFGVIYGMGAFRLAESLGISRKQAQEYIDQYFARYPGVRRYFQQLSARAEEVGYVETLFGRRRYLRDIDTEGRDAGHAIRSLNNAPLQGSAADIIKLAMIKLTRQLQRFGGDAHLLLQVHDELVLEVRAERAAEIEQLVRHEMENAVELGVPLRVDVQLADAWGA